MKRETKKRRKPRANKQGLHKCEYCGSTANVEWVEDPYYADIHDDHTHYWLCDKCVNDRADEI